MARRARGGDRGEEEHPPTLVAWHPGPRQLLWLAARRARGGGAPLVAVGLGLLIAVVLLCAVPLYIDQGTNAQLLLALTASPADTNIEVLVAAPDSTQQTSQVTISGINGVVPNSIRQVAPATMTYLEGPLLSPSSINGRFVAQENGTLAGANLQLFAYDLAGARPHMRLISGRFPADTPTHGMPEVLATPQSELHIGDLVTSTILGVNAKPLSVRVVGIWFPRDPSDPYWNGRSFLVQAPASDNPTLPPPTYPLMTTPAAYFATLGQVQPSPSTTVHEVFYVQTDRVTSSNMAAVAEGLRIFETRLSANIVGGVQIGPGGPRSNVTIATRLDVVIATVQRQFALSALPLYIVIVQVIGLALLFVITMASLLVERQAGEIAVLKSRGASDAQTLGALTASSFFPALLAVAVGPVSAAALSLLLVRFGVPGTGALVAREFNARYLARAALAGGVVLPALAGALLGIAALAVPAWQAARLDVLAFRREQARSTHVPIWRRYYLDLVLAGFCAAGYLELSAFGGLGVRGILAQSGKGNPTLLLLAAPALLLLAGGLVLLRVVPRILNLGFRAAARARGATGLLAFAQLTRGAARFSQLTLLLTLSVAVGLFALTFQASLGRNAADRAAFETGSDMRVQLGSNVNNTLNVPEIAQRMPSLPGVAAATGITRTTAQTPDNEGDAQIPLVGIDPSTFARAAYWRADFADQPLSTLLAALSRHAGSSSAGQPGSPIWSLVSANFAQTWQLQPGMAFSLTSLATQDVTAHFVVGAVLRDFPTLFDPSTGYIVVATTDLATASAASGIFTPPVNGPNEWWLRLTPSPAAAAAVSAALNTPDFHVDAIALRTELLKRFLSDPEAAAVTALLLSGGLLAACLAVLGGLVQAAGTVRQRMLQFAILRALGTSTRELTNMFLLEQVAMYVAGLVGGILLGLALASATLPYLEFATLLTDTAPPGVPPYVLVVNPRDVLLFLGALALAFALGLLWQRQVALRVVLGRTLRLGED